MDISTRREDLVEMDRVKRRLDNARIIPLPDEDCSNRHQQSQDQVRPDIIHQGACESFVDGAGI